jgi:dipeptidyl aminopeptidase/acylaminoacyl peptidase
MRRAAALIGILALTALFGGWRIAAAQTGAACRNDAAPIDRPAPDALPLAPNAIYTATWRLLNTGDCTWGDGYVLTPIDAAALGNPSAAVTAPVAPGETLTVTLTLTAPIAPGYHQGVWRLTDPSAAAFGPWLPLEIDVAGAAANPDAAVGDIALPEVLAMSGFGSMAIGDELTYYEDPCAATEDTPTWVLGDIYFSGLSRGRELHLCNVTPGSTVGVTLTAPTGDVFTRTLTVPAPVNFFDPGGNAYTRTLVSVSASWLANAASGPWRVAAAGGEIETQFDLPPIANPPRWLRRWLDNRPVATADPFAAAQGCHYAYATGEPFYLTGHGLPPDAPVRLGIYVTRLGVFYFLGDLEVITDAGGSFRKLIPPDSDFAEPGQEHTVYLFEGLSPSSFAPDGVSYDPFLSSGVPSPLSVCYTVRLADDAPPLRLAFATGTAGVPAATIAYLSPKTAWPAYITDGIGPCTAGSPAWAADGSLIYHNDCGNSYDLIRHPDPSVLEELELTDVTPTAILTTPEFDETEPTVAADGRIVFRRAPAGTDPAAAGELWLLEPGATEPVSLGIQGHAPAWSPDGTQIAYMADTDGSWQVYLYDLATAATRLVSVDCPDHCRYPAWSPDGSQIVYSATASADDLTPTALWLATPAAGTAQPWQTGAYDQPSWSATGWVIFTGPDGLYRARPDQPAAAPQRYLYNTDAFYGDPAWSY